MQIESSKCIEFCTDYTISKPIKLYSYCPSFSSLSLKYSHSILYIAHEVISPLCKKKIYLKIHIFKTNSFKSLVWIRFYRERLDRIIARMGIAQLILGCRVGITVQGSNTDRGSLGISTSLICISLYASVSGIQSADPLSQHDLQLPLGVG